MPDRQCRAAGLIPLEKTPKPVVETHVPAFSAATDETIDVTTPRHVLIGRDRPSFFLYGSERLLRAVIPKHRGSILLSPRYEQLVKEHTNRIGYPRAV